MIEEKVFKRGKNKIQNVFTLKESYIYYIKDIDKDSKYYIDYKTYRRICESSNKLISNIIIEEGKEVKLPYQLGVLRIRKHKINFKNLKLDYGVYKDTGLPNKHLNEHSNNYYCRFYWNKVRATLIKNKSAYCFLPTRNNKRTLSKLIKESPITQINKYFD